MNKKHYNNFKESFKQKLFSRLPFSFFLLAVTMLISCSVSYSFQGGKINYDIIKTITIHEFPNRATLVVPTLASTFDLALRNRFIEQTRLISIPNNGDIEIEGEIIGYDIQGVAVKEDAYASRARVTITVKVRYTNNKEPDSDVNKNFTASREFDSSQTLEASVQESLNKEIVDELIDMIYNETVANW
ncbi:hypothetical protein M2138_000709 [Dysgonomonadaceae bacterium PH5-43]|nr:hypothetical protein [Dysgonomonadaceae bacterium PH5-43]